MKNFRAFLFLLLLLLPVVALSALQDTPAVRLEITGVNSSQMPVVIVNANVYDMLGQPMLGLTEENFSLRGDLTPEAEIVRVENVSDDNLPFATVLMIDVSTSMSDTPIANAKRAAQAFIDNVGPNDPVAIMTFGSSVRLLQDYTTDKAALTAVIDSLQAGGETALYQGAYDAIGQAANSPTMRRAVILLSDGAEYGDASSVGRGDAAAEALARGVPVYTIGLGFGIDRTYLQDLSASTSSQFYESPTPEQLTEIYTNLAAQLRSQYIITLNAPQPLDGTEYTMLLEVTTEQGSADASAVLRAPIPVPILRLPDVPAALSEPTEIVAVLLADDPVESVTFQIDGQEPVAAEPAAPSFPINPVDYAPGAYTLTASATDDDGDTGTASVEFTVAALPSQITLVPDPASLGEIAEPVTIGVETSGQTETNNASVSFDDGDKAQLSAPFAFSIDPLDFAPGEHRVAVSVTNEGGVSSSEVVLFNVAPLPPVITVTGLADGQSIDTPTEFSVETVSQEDAAVVSVSVDGTVIEADDEGVYTLDPMDFAPGVNRVTVEATAANGRSSQTQIDVVIAALPPEISVSGLEAGETLSEDRTISLEFISQSPVVAVTLTVDDAPLADLTSEPFEATLRVLDYAPGAHVLQIAARNADGQSSTLDVPFSIAAAPAATATQIAGATSTQQFVATAAEATAVQATALQSTSIAVTGTQIAAATATGAAEATALQATAAQQAALAAEASQVAGTQSALATQVAVEQAATQAQVEANATQAAVEQAATQAQVEANATQAAVEQEATAAQATALQVTSEAEREATAAAVEQEATALQATALNEQATATDIARATALANNLATLDARMTATSDARATVTAEQAATQASLATLDADASATNVANQEATATQEAQENATQAAQSSATAAVLDATATAEGLATQEALDEAATQDARGTATDIARATALANNLATLDARMTATAAAQATEEAEATAAQANVLQATQSINATRDAQATATAQRQETLAALEATATARAEATLDALNATATQESIVASATALQATAAQETLAALEATATALTIDATATRHNLETRTADNATATQAAENATATLAAEQAALAQATADNASTQSAVATGERAARMTVTAQAIADASTATAQAIADASTATAQAATLAVENADATAQQATAAVVALATDTAAGTATSVAQAEAESQLTDEPTATVEGGAAQATEELTPSPQPTLTEVQASEAASSNITPILIVGVVIILIIIVLVLIMRGRGSPGMRN